MPVIEEIVVVGKKDPFSWDWGFSEEYDREEEGREDEREAEEARREAAEEANEQEAFAPPVLLPVIEEIVVTATRAEQVAAASRYARFNLAGIAAWAGGMIFAEGLREVSQQRLDEAGRLAIAPVAPRPDTPLQVMQPEVIPEIIVTGQRQYVRAPQPQFYDRDFDPDPWFMETVYPRVMPTTPSVTTTTTPLDIPAPQPVVAPQPLPQIMPQPLSIPQLSPFAEPSVSPATRPATQPATRPGLLPGLLPFVAPATAPGLMPGITASPGLMPGLQITPGTMAQPKTGLFASLCPTPAQVKAKCKKDKDKPREKCYRKLVKENRLPSMDDVYKWAEIDCDTGRELRN